MAQLWVQLGIGTPRAGLGPLGELFGRLRRASAAAARRAPAPAGGNMRCRARVRVVACALPTLLAWRRDVAVPSRFRRSGRGTDVAFGLRRRWLDTRLRRGRRGTASELQAPGGGSATIPAGCAQGVVASTSARRNL